jgi:hypothetical protein
MNEYLDLARYRHDIYVEPTRGGECPISRIANNLGTLFAAGRFAPDYNELRKRYSAKNAVSGAVTNRIGVKGP